MTIPQTPTRAAGSRPDTLLRTVTVTDSGGCVLFTRTVAALTAEDALRWVTGHLPGGENGDRR